jgi:hypothetical protein
MKTFFLALALLLTCTLVVICVASTAHARNVVELKIDYHRGAACSAEVRLVEGKARFRVARTGRTVRLTRPGTVVCVARSGKVRYSRQSHSILGF